MGLAKLALRNVRVEFTALHNVWWRVEMESSPPFRERERVRELVIFCVDLAAAVYGKWQIGTEIESGERKVSSEQNSLWIPSSRLKHKILLYL